MTTLFVSQKLQISVQKFQKIDVQKHSIVNSFFTSFIFETTCEFVEKSIVIYSFFFAKIIDFFCNIKKFCNKYENIFAIRFIQLFKFLDCDTRNHVEMHEKCIRNRKNCKNFRKIDREYSNSNYSHSHKNEN